MKRKFDIANRLNNNFQKGVIFFVALMVLTIPNMCVYSSIGSYKTSSIAIMAIKAYEPSRSEGEKCIQIIYAEAAFFAVIVGVSFVGGLVIASVLGTQKGRVEDNNIDANHAKYDFSKFDN